MSTVQLIEADQAPLLARVYYADGDPGPIVGALAQVPELLTVALPFIGTALGPSAIGWRTKEIVIVRTSALQQCRFCVQTHTVVALDAGLDRDQVAACATADRSTVRGSPTRPSAHCCAGSTLSRSVRGRSTSRPETRCGSTGPTTRSSNSPRSSP